MNAILTWLGVTPKPKPSPELTEAIEALNRAAAKLSMFDGANHAEYCAWHKSYLEATVRYNNAKQ